MTDNANPKMVDRILATIPVILASKPVIILGIVLFLYLVVFGGVSVAVGHPQWVPVNVQLILGNLTNVSSMVGAGIAAGAGVKAAHHHHKAAQLLAEVRDLIADHKAAQ